MIIGQSVYILYFLNIIDINVWCTATNVLNYKHSGLIETVVCTKTYDDKSIITISTDFVGIIYYSF